MNLQKQKPVRSKKYLEWVRTQPCCVCDSPETIAHHIIGVGQGCTGGKASDLYTMPLCHEHHQELHLEGNYIDMQWAWISRTMATAIEQEAKVLSTISV